MRVTGRRLFQFVRAEAGIGTLILFIAFVLVAAIAAAVLIETQSSLQSKSLATGVSAQKQVSTGLSVLSIYGENSSMVAQINYLFATVRLTPGSDAFTLNNSLVEIFTATNTASYNYASTGNCTVSWMGNPVLAKGKFAVVSQIGYNVSGVLQSNDVVLVCVTLPIGVNESQYITWEMAPQNGVFTRVKTQTPNVMSTDKVFLYP